MSCNTSSVPSSAFRILGLLLLLSTTGSSTATTTSEGQNQYSLVPNFLRTRSLQNQLFPWSSRGGSGSGKCTTVTPVSDAEFNLTRYVEKSWFIQRQQVNPYQSAEALHCVSATYNLRDDGFIQVLNNARTGSVDAPDGSPTVERCLFATLCAQQIEGGQLLVCPCVFGPIFGLTAGPYWVAALDSTNYEWAIIIAGQPNVKVSVTDDGRQLCSTTNSTCFLNVNGSGLWLLTRAMVASDETIAAMVAKLVELGIAPDNLLRVQQEGCTYPDYVKT